MADEAETPGPARAASLSMYQCDEGCVHVVCYDPNGEAVITAVIAAQGVAQFAAMFARAAEVVAQAGLAMVPTEGSA